MDTETKTEALKTKNDAGIEGKPMLGSKIKTGYRKDVKPRGSVSMRSYALTQWKAKKVKGVWQKA